MEPSPQTAGRRRASGVGARLLPWGIGAALIGLFYWIGAPVCPTRRVLGLPCPGCGMTRAGVELLTLDLAGAFQQHPMVFVAAPLLGWVAASSILASPRLRMPPIWLWAAAAVALLAVWILRLAGYLGGHPDL